MTFVETRIGYRPRPMPWSFAVGPRPIMTQKSCLEGMHPAAAKAQVKTKTAATLNCIIDLSCMLKWYALIERFGHLAAPQNIFLRCAKSKIHKIPQLVFLQKEWGKKTNILRFFKTKLRGTLRRPSTPSDRIEF